MIRAVVIFLDVDGVLNIKRAVRSERPMSIRRNGIAYRPPPFSSRLMTSFVSSAVENVNQLFDETGAIAVLCSTWRSQSDAREQLHRHGLRCTWHTDWRTDTDDRDRGAQISAWLQAHGNPRYLVIDDWSRELAQHSKYLVRVNYRTGFSDADRQRAALLISRMTCGDTDV